jgi:hypothetical protein
MTDVDATQSTAPLAAYCFMTGYMYVCLESRVFLSIDFLLTSDVISFSAIFVWCGFQTGNFAQVCRKFRKV